MPDEYISREAVLSMQYRAEEGCGLDDIVKVSDIEAIPAADVAPVVRCKLCQHWHEGEHNYGECDRLGERDREGGASFDCSTEASDYCSDGYRKENCE